MHQQLLAQLLQQGHKSKSLFTYPQIRDQIDRVIRTKSDNLYSFPESIAAEIWNQCEKTMAGQVTLLQYVRVVFEAKQILETRVRLLEHQIKEKRDQIGNHEKYCSTIRSTDFRRVQLVDEKLWGLKQELQDILSSKEEAEKDLKVLSFLFNQGQAPRAINEAHSQSRAVATLTSESNPSEVFVKRSTFALKLVLIVTVLVLLLEPFIMMAKHHFLGLITGLSLLSLFTLHNFSKIFVRVCICQTLFSVIMDILWFFCKGITFFHATLMPEESHLRTTLLELSVVLLGVSSVLRLGIFCVLLSYTKDTEGETVEVLGLNFQVSGESNNVSRQLELCFY